MSFGNTGNLISFFLSLSFLSLLWSLIFLLHRNAMSDETGKQPAGTDTDGNVDDDEAKEEEDMDVSLHNESGDEVDVEALMKDASKYLDSPGSTGRKKTKPLDTRKPSVTSLVNNLVIIPRIEVSAPDKGPIDNADDGAGAGVADIGTGTDAGVGTGTSTGTGTGGNCQTGENVLKKPAPGVPYNPANVQKNNENPARKHSGPDQKKKPTQSTLPYGSGCGGGGK
jgi:hypothetical protein